MTKVGRFSRIVVVKVGVISANGWRDTLIILYPRGVILMKKSSIWGIVVAALALIGVIVALCIYMKELRRLWTTFWDKLQAKRANLQIYMD